MILEWKLDGNALQKMSLDERLHEWVRRAKGILNRRRLIEHHSDLTHLITGLKLQKLTYINAT